MARREDIVNDIWDDPPFCDLSGPAQHIYLWSFTNPKVNMAGLYKVQLFEFGAGKWSEDVRDQAVAELVELGLLVYERPWLWVVARVKRIVARNPYVARSIAADIARMDVDHPLRVAWLERYGDFPWLRNELAKSLSQPQLAEAPETVKRPSLVSALESENPGPSQDGPTARASARAVDDPSPTAGSSLPEIDAGDIRQIIDVLNMAVVNDGLRELSEAYGDDMKVLSALIAVPPPDGTEPLEWALKAAHSVVARGKANVGRADSFLRELKALKANHDTAQTRLRTFSAIDGGGEDAARQRLADEDEEIRRQLRETERKIAEADR